MPEAVALGALAAGACCSAGLLVAGYPGRPALLSGATLRNGMVGLAGALSDARRRLALGAERAGWRPSARVAALGAGCACCLAVPAGLISPILALVYCFGCGAGFLLALTAAIAARRRRLAGELVPLLELFTLELSGGGSALAALGSVSVQVESELAADLRRMLVASQPPGSQSFEARLLDYSERQVLPELGTLATILAATRDYGTAAGQGVRALATDLRRAQRRELIAQSRRALNNVLLPAAVAVLLPFLGILLFPAVSVLQSSLR
jgi:Flp pilus assembly protein TadB